MMISCIMQVEKLKGVEYPPLNAKSSITSTAEIPASSGLLEKNQHSYQLSTIQVKRKRKKKSLEIAQVPGDRVADPHRGEKKM